MKTNRVVYDVMTKTSYVEEYEFVPTIRPIIAPEWALADTVDKKLELLRKKAGIP